VLIKLKNEFLLQITPILKILIFNLISLHRENFVEVFNVLPKMSKRILENLYANSQYFTLAFILVKVFFSFHDFIFMIETHRHTRTHGYLSAIKPNQASLTIAR